MGRFWIRLAILALLCLGSGEALATNGMNMIGYGAVSSAMGGADLAIVDNATAININPAGLCACASPEMSIGLGLPPSIPSVREARKPTPSSLFIRR